MQTLKELEIEESSATEPDLKEEMKASDVSDKSSKSTEDEKEQPIITGKEEEPKEAEKEAMNRSGITFSTSLAPPKSSSKKTVRKTVKKKVKKSGGKTFTINCEHSKYAYLMLQEVMK